MELLSYRWCLHLALAACSLALLAAMLSPRTVIDYRNAAGLPLAQWPGVPLRLSALLLLGRAWYNRIALSVLFLAGLSRAVSLLRQALSPAFFSLDRGAALTHYTARSQAFALRVLRLASTPALCTWQHVPSPRPAGKTFCLSNQAARQMLCASLAAVLTLLAALVFLSPRLTYVELSAIPEGESLSSPALPGMAVLVTASRSGPVLAVPGDAGDRALKQWWPVRLSGAFVTWVGEQPLVAISALAGQAELENHSASPLRVPLPAPGREYVHIPGQSLRLRLERLAETGAIAAQVVDGTGQAVGESALLDGEATIELPGLAIKLQRQRQYLLWLVVWPLWLPVAFLGCLAFLALLALLLVPESLVGLSALQRGPVTTLEIVLPPGRRRPPLWLRLALAILR